MGQSSSLETTENIKESEEDHLHDNRRRRYKKVDVKSYPKNINESQEDDVTQSPIDSFFPIMNTAEAPSSYPKAMSSSIVETTNPSKEDGLKANKIATTSVGLASKIIPKRPWTSYHLFPTNATPISDSKARMIRSPRIQPKDNKGNETNRNIARGRIKFVEPPRLSAACNQNRLEELSKQNEDIDQLITMMQNHKVSDDNSSSETSRHTYVPSSEFQFSFTTTPSQYASPVNSNRKELEEYEEQFKYDTIKSRKILPLPKRKLKRDSETTIGSVSSNGSLSSIPTSPFTFSSDKTMPKASFLTDASRNMLQQQKQQQTQDPIISSETGNNVDSLTNSRKDRPSTSKKMKSMERVQAALINDEKAATTGKRKESASGHPMNFKTPPKMEVFTSYSPPAKEDHFDFSNFNFKFDSDNDAKPKPLKKQSASKSRKNATAAAKPVTINTTNDTNSTNTPNKGTATYSHNVFAGKSAKDTKKLLSVKPQPPTVKRPSISQSVTTSATKTKGKESDKKKSANTNKATKKNKKSKNKKEEVAPGGFLSSDITLFENPLSDDWICFFCQFDIFCHGMEDARKKNGYYRRKNDRLRRANDTKKITSAVESSDDLFDEEHHHHSHA